MASIDFDAVLDYLGAEGRYQTVLYYLLCIPATVPAAFLAFNQVFLSASPSHWCHVPELMNLSIAERKALAIPVESSSSSTVGGIGIKYSECTMYNIDFNRVLAAYNSDLMRAGESGSSSIPIADPDWPVINCPQGWEFDTTQYDATLVTEVNITISRAHVLHLRLNKYCKKKRRSWYANYDAVYSLLC